jgi:hypothetical protein
MAAVTSAAPRTPCFPLPASWPRHTRSAVVAAVGLARLALLHVRGWAANSTLERARLRSENDSLRSEVEMLERENHELRAKRGAKLELCVGHLEGRKHLPVVSLRRAA